MRTKLYTLLITIGIMVAGTASASLWSYYDNQGLNLPSVAERTPQAISCGIEDYQGTEAQNIALESCLQDDMTLGVAIPDVVALFEDNLGATLEKTGTSMTLISGNDKIGNALSGTFGFIIDEGTTKEEFVIATCAGTACTGLERGISVEDGKTEVTALKFKHRMGASVKMTNFPILGRIARILNAEDSLENMPYVSSTTYLPTDARQLATKYYVDTVGAGGFTAVNVSTTRGLEALGTSPETVGVNVSSTQGMYQGTDGLGIYQMASTTKNLNQDSEGIYLEGDDDLTWAGEQTFSATTTLATTTITSSTIINLNSTTSTITNLCIGSECASSVSDLISLTTTTAMGTWDVSSTISATTDETFIIDFQPKYIEIDYLIQGHDSSAQTSKYFLKRGNAYFTGTTQTNAYTMPCDSTTNSDNDCSMVAGAFDLPNPVDNESLGVGGAGSGDFDISAVLTVNSVDSTGFTLRCVTDTGTGTTGSVGRCNGVWTAYR